MQWGRSFTFVVNGVPIFAKGVELDPGRLLPHARSPTSTWST